MRTVTGTITATGSGNGVSDTALDGYGPASMGVVSVSGTFTSAVIVVEKKLRGGAVWLPVMLQDESTMIRSTTGAPTNSTTTSWRVDLGGAGAWRVYVSSGTPTSVAVEMASGSVEEFGGILPAAYTTITGGTSFGAGITFSGATGANDINITDNLASALDITEGSNSYLNFVTTNSAEACVFSKTVRISGAIDLEFLGTTGQSEITMTDNLADALSVKVLGGADLIVFTTTNSAEAVTITGLRTTSTTAAAITGATTLTLADAGGVFNIDQDAAFDIALPDPTTGEGCRYTFVITDAGANNVTISTTGASTFVGTIVNDVTSVIPATGSTLTFASGTAAVGDTIEAISLTTSLYLIRAVTSAAGGITVA